MRAEGGELAGWRGLRPARGRIAAARVDGPAIAYSICRGGAVGAGDVPGVQARERGDGNQRFRLAQRTAFAVLAAISVCHLLNDMMQSLMPAHLSDAEGLASTSSFGQIGLITLAFQLTASLLQPLVGMLHRPPAAALFARRRHGLHAGRPAAAVGRRQLPGAAAGGRAGRHRARRSSTRNPRASRAWPRAAGTASRSRCSRSAAMPARRSGRCSPPSSCCRSASAASPGSRWRRCSRIVAAVAVSAAGTGATARRAGRAAAAPARAGLPRRAGRRSRLAVLLALMFSKYLLPGEPDQLLTPST